VVTDLLREIAGQRMAVAFTAIAGPATIAWVTEMIAAALDDRFMAFSVRVAPTR
jgi:hypothetical protein